MNVKKYSAKKRSKLILFDMHGYDFSKIDLFLSVIGLGLLIGGVCIIHKQNVYYSLIIMISVFITFPIIISGYCMYKAEKRRFEEYCTYFEYMKLYYKIYNKVIIALKETSRQFDESTAMCRYIQEAIDEIEKSGDYRKALNYISGYCSNTHLERLHSLLIMGETQGPSGIGKSLDLINYENWKQNMVVHQRKKKSARMMLFLFLAFALVTSVMSVFVANQTELTKALFETSSYQLYTFIDLESVLIIFVATWTFLVNKKWIRSDE